ncbi:MAG: response regulator [Bacteroidetes bacterium]|nr:response regulator [Bacteroidota bacterium]
MNTEKLHILLADDDKDDRFLFQEALSELPLATELKTVHDGEQLMAYLMDNAQNLPDVLFLDLNMPRKTGFECLSEIKITDELMQLPVIMFSTSYPRDMNYEQDMIKMLYKIGATDYIRKPANFAELKEVIHNSLLKIEELIKTK